MQIHFQVFRHDNLENDLPEKKVRTVIPTIIEEDKIIQSSIKKRQYEEPIISRSPQKDKLEIW